MNPNTNRKLKFITIDEIIVTHEKIITQTGGEFGILNRGNLEFIIDFIESQVYAMSISDLNYLSSIILRGIISGHPFIDGNKRAGIEATDLFLRKNGYYLEMDVDEGFSFALAVAKNELNMDSIYEWIRNHSKRLK